MLYNKHHEFLTELQDKEYRQAFMEELVGTSLAFQVRRLREARGWTQENLATETGKAQETISQWENPSYGRYSLSTLKQLARAFDVALLVRCVSFSELANWTVDVTPERQTPPNYEQERQLSLRGIRGPEVLSEDAVLTNTSNTGPLPPRTPAATVSIAYQGELIDAVA
jgi:transcriptional regulator with XRE-family HTH domain